MKNLDTVIDNYLTGNLSPDELTNFEKQISENPSIQKELAQQKEIIESIKQARRNELKAKLSSMSPKAGPSIPQKLIIASATLLGATALTLGIYATVGTNKAKEINTSAVSSTEKTIKVEEKENVISNALEINKVTKNEVNDQEIEVAILQTTEASSLNSVVEKSTPSTPTTNTRATSTKVNIDDLIADDISDELDDIRTIESSGPEEITASTISSTKQITYGIKENCNEQVNGYTYSKGSLELCGNFKESEFIIYKDASKNQFYFSYQNDYYKIVESDSFQKFEDNLLTDPRVIKQLPK